MDEGRLSAEKELLKLIEGSAGPSASSAPAAVQAKVSAQIKTQAAKRQVASIFDFGAFLGRLYFFRDWFKQGAKGGKIALDIRALNNILVISTLVLAGYFVANFSYLRMNSKKILNMEPTLAEIKDTLGPIQTSSLKVVSYYIDKAKAKNIFSMAGFAVVKETKTQEERDKVMDLVKDLKLVGISWSDDPDVIIEDKKAQQTFFLKKGGQVADFYIKAVLKDKVVLTYGDQEVELR